jgi:hypothetical protein
MGGLNKRVQRLRDRTPDMGHERRVLSEAERHSRWLSRQRVRHREATPKSAHHAREYLAWLRMVGRVPDDVETLIEQVMAAPDASGYMQPPAERSRPVTEAAIYAAIWRGDEGLEHLVIPAEWAAALEASETLAERFLSMPAEVVAEWWVASRTLRERGEPNEAIEEHAQSYEGRYGITEELLTTALGPDADLLTDEEGHWMVAETIADAMTGEWGWQVHNQIVKQSRQGGLSNE